MGAATLGPVAAAATELRASEGREARKSHESGGLGAGCGEREETVMGVLRSVLLAGGGTGGHIYPLLAFADCLRRHDPDVRITCVGTPKGLENELIPPAGYDLRQIPAYQLPRSVNMNLLRTPDRMWRSARAAGKVIDEVQADVVVGFGGYVSVPAYLAAWRRELPLVIHEVNVPPGVANRMGMKFTKFVAAGFPHQPAQAEALRNARVVGVPLRTSISHLDRAELREQARKHFGLRPDLPIPYVTLPYLSEMELGYAAADLMLGRGGAMTCAEAAAIGLPAVYVPYPHSNQEQKRNALPVVEAGGGLLVDDSELSPDWIERMVIPLARDPQRLAAMGAAAAAYGRRDGDEALLDYVYEAVAAQ
jgi:UDP-N-acetylglucosamine--N-acetylmuramyl-(pentapeptide) pyrophosphoryl-undecaprenol N-acetylglucosamine transferase